MRKNLTRKERKHGKAILALLVTSLLLEKLDKEMGSSSDNPAVAQCISMIDDLLANKDKLIRDRIIEKVQRKRLQLTKKVRNIDLGCATVGCLRVITSGIFRTNKGTKFDFILQTFSSNLSSIEEVIPFSDDQVKLFSKHFCKVINSM